jgi:hypothetical protein
VDLHHAALLPFGCADFEVVIVGRHGERRRDGRFTAARR